MMILKRSSHFSKFEQCLAVNVTRKPDGNINLGKHFFDLPRYMSYIGRKKPAAVTAKVAVIRLLPSSLFLPPGIS